jgi:hypothetical protein
MAAHELFARGLFPMRTADHNCAPHKVPTGAAVIQAFGLLVFGAMAVWAPAGAAVYPGMAPNLPGSPMAADAAAVTIFMVIVQKWSDGTPNRST